MAIWVIKDGQREGPYEEQDVRELIYEGTYTDADPAISEGQFYWSTVGDILGHNHLPPDPASASSVAEATLAPPTEEQALPADEPAAPPVLPAPLPEPPLIPSAEPPPLRVTVVDFRMPFGSMIVFMVNWAIASIPALLILGIVAGLCWAACMGILSALAR